MRKFLVLSTLCLSLPAHAANDKPESTGWFGSFFSSKKKEAPKPCTSDTCQMMRLSARHIENKGIGYQTGYTTLEAFFAPPANYWSFLPFLDLRGHLFNNGKCAANGGVGLRTLQKNRVYGAYAYYDYRNTSHKDFSQVSFGLETLGMICDLRLNGYVVVGSRKSHGFNTQFAGFSGNNLLYSQRFEYALSGGNGEVGFHLFNNAKNLDCYTAVGPYYLIGPMGSGVWGGEGRVKATWKKWLGLEASYSYDHKFKNIVQGQLFLSIPFGAKEKPRKASRRSCTDNRLLCMRMSEPVAKAEIIPVSSKRKVDIAYNPATGTTYFIGFVDNLSHSAGTIESPHATLADAAGADPYDIIYVFPGDMTSNGLSSGIKLLDNQQLLGATMSHAIKTDKGTIVVPALASGNPALLTNASGDVVTLGNNNKVEGLYIQNLNGHGIVGNGISGATITQNVIQGNSMNNGIQLVNVGGELSCSNNTVSNQITAANISDTNVHGAKYAFMNNSFCGNIGMAVSYTNSENNSFSSQGDSIYAIAVSTPSFMITCTNDNANAPNTFNISGSALLPYDAYGVQFVLNQFAVADLNVGGSTFNSSSCISVVTNDNSVCSSVIGSNIFNGSDERSVQIISNGGSIMSMMFTGNTLNGNEMPMYITTNGTSSMNMHFSGNIVYAYNFPFEINTNDSSILSGDFSGNQIISGSDGYGVTVNSGNYSTFAANFTGNTFNNLYYHMTIYTNDNSAYKGDIIGNTFTGMDDDEILYWNVASAATVTSRIANNTFNADYYGISYSTQSSEPSTIEITGNLIQNMSNTGIYVSLGGTGDLYANISSNTFNGVGIPAIQVANSATAGTFCLEFNDNKSNLYPNAYLFQNTGTGVFNLISPQGNTGQLSTQGSVNRVTSCN